MKKGKNDETLEKLAKKNSNEVCLTEEELESASGGYKITQSNFQVTEQGKEPYTVTRYEAEGYPKSFLKLLQGKSMLKIFKTKEEAENWAKKNLF